MSRWIDQFENHTFTTMWRQLFELSRDDELHSVTDGDAATEVARLCKAILFLEKLREQVDPELMPKQLLDQMNQHATNCYNELNSYRSSKNLGNLQNANSHIDSLLALFGQIPTAEQLLPGEKLGELAKDYSHSLSESLRAFIAQLESDLKELVGQIASLTDRAGAAGQQIGAVQSEIKTVQQTVQAQTAEFNTQFKSGEESRSQRFEKQAGELSDRSDEEFKSLAGKSAAILEVLAQLKSDAEEVYGVTIGTLQAGAYASYATEERRTANLFRWGALILMLVGVGILVIPELQRLLVAGAEYEFDWLRIVGRATLSLVVFVPAFYLARESGRHRNNEIVNRRRQHILSTIDPYLALIDKDKAEEVKAEVAKAIFSEGPAARSDSDGDTGNLIAQITNLVKQAKR